MKELVDFIVLFLLYIFIFFIYKINSLSTKTFTSSNGREGEYLIYPIKNLRAYSYGYMVMELLNTLIQSQKII